MSSRKAFRVVPSRNGLRAAETWRFWRSGDEFYAAARSMARVSKISFHRHGNWQVSIGSTMIRLVPTREVLPGWLYVISIQWFILPDALRPPPRSTENIELVDVPEGSKLALNLLVSVAETTREPSVPHEGGRYLWYDGLRGGRRIFLHASTLPLTDQDRETASHHLGLIRLSLRAAPPSDFYAEFAWIISEPEVGNVMAIVPFTRDVLRRARIDGSGL